MACTLLSESVIFEGLIAPSNTAFNAAFGITTDFAAVQPIDDQGNAVGAAAAGTVSASGSAAAPSAPAAVSSSNSGSSSGAAAASGGIGDFGSCSVPQIEFGAGFGGRKETSFEPVDQSRRPLVSRPSVAG